MDSDDDYMSESFVVPVNNDIRPGLIHNKRKQHEIKIEQKKKLCNAKHKEVFKPLRVLEAERRAAGLEEALSPSNKGFAMLQKMGFKPGDSLGATGRTGLTKPIDINVKVNRTGLGRDEAIKETRLKRLEQIKNKPVMSVEEYRASLAAKYNNSTVLRDINKCANSCYNLDLENGVTTPKMPWFWPKHCLPNVSEVDSDSEEDDNEGEEETEDISYTEKLEQLIDYLRATYFFCSWCGCKYDMMEDLLDSCPGPQRDDH